MEEIELEYYETCNGVCPYIEWESELPKELQAQIRKRLARVRLGHLGDINDIEAKNQLFELRIHLGPGYRIYFGRKGKKLVILLCAGNKGSQKRDILRAKKYWQDCP